MFIKSHGFSDSDEKYLEVAKQPIQAMIEGGSQRILSWENETVFDGSASSNPNIIEGNSDDLAFKWYCKVKPGALNFAVGKGGCFGYGDGLVEYDDAVWKLPPREFIRNALYIITLVVESKLDRKQNASFQQVVNIRTGTVLRTTIK